MMRLSLARLAVLAVAVTMLGCGSDAELSPEPSPVPSPAPAPSPSPSPAPSTCSTTVSDLPAAVPARGGDFSFGVTTGAGCEWTAGTDVGWADVSPGSGVGSGRLLLRVGEHSRLDSRTLTVTVNSQAFRISQTGVGCVYTVNPVALEVADEGGRLTFTLTTMAGCGWTAASSVGWLTVTTPSGTGSGSVLVQVASNAGDVRQGFVTVAGQRVTITQRRG